MIYPNRRIILSFLLIFSSSCFAQPLLDSWCTSLSGQYARIFESKEAAQAETSLTTWPSTGDLIQALPAYTDIQKIEYSDNFVYITATGLASHPMGPWYLDDTKSQLSDNFPTNQNTLTQIPRSPVEATSKETTQLDPIGLWVNGVALFNMLDGAFYDNGTESQDDGTGIQTAYWVRNNMPNNVVTFDNAYGCPSASGSYHYCANPKALRYQLNDNVVFIPASGADHAGVYYDDGSEPIHSPILGWSYDGFPIYGPYGYDDPDISSTDTTIRRMASGFVRRNGSFGTVDLAMIGRNTLPKWAAEMRGLVPTGSIYAITDNNKVGPDVDTTYPIGYWVEDYAYLGDLGYTQGVDFDLDIYNGRFCRTPEFPEGTYAYFVTIDANGDPEFPYVIGRQWYGEVSGGAVTEVTETTTVHLEAGPNTTITVTQSAVDLSSDTVSMTWTSVEGGSYSVDISTDLSSWQGTGNPIDASELVTSSVTPISTESTDYQFYRVSLASLDDYDSEGTIIVEEVPDDTEDPDNGELPDEEDIPDIPDIPDLPDLPDLPDIPDFPPPSF